MRRDVLVQELHLVGEDPAVRRGSGTRPCSARTARRAAASRLPRACGSASSGCSAAGRHDVHPRVAAAARHRQDVVAGQPEERELAAAERADVAVAAEELAVVERRDLVEALDRHRLALIAMIEWRGDARTLAGQARDAAAGGEGVLAERPGHEVLRVVEARLLPRHPAVGHTVLSRASGSAGLPSAADECVVATDCA